MERGKDRQDGRRYDDERATCWTWIGATAIGVGIGLALHGLVEWFR